MSTLIDSIPNRPADKPVFDFQITQGLCRVVLVPVSNDGNNLVMTGWAYRIHEDGTPVLDDATASPIATTDSTRTVHLSGVMAGTHSLYDGWVRYVPDTQTVLDAETLPEGWTTGTGAPTDPAAYGAGYYDTASGLGYVYAQGCLTQAGQSVADALEAQSDTATKMAALGL